MRTMPASNEAQNYSVVNHNFDLHLADGKWSVHLATCTGRGRFFGPQQAEGTLEILGKLVCRSSCHLPRQVRAALEKAGYGCDDYIVA